MTILLWLLGGAQRVWAYLRTLSPQTIAIIALAALSAFLWHNASGWKGKAIAEKSAKAKLVAETKAATTAYLVKVAGRMLREERERTRINKESADEARTRFASLDARYDGLWRSYTASRGSGPAQTPALPDPKRGFDATACGEGLLCIPAETAFGLMRAADDNTTRLVLLQDWVRKQAAVDPNEDASPAE